MPAHAPTQSRAHAALAGAGRPAARPTHAGAHAVALTERACLTTVHHRLVHTTSVAHCMHARSGLALLACAYGCGAGSVRGACNVRLLHGTAAPAAHEPRALMQYARPPLRFVPGSGPGRCSAAVSSGSVTACATHTPTTPLGLCTKSACSTGACCLGKSSHTSSAPAARPPARTAAFSMDGARVRRNRGHGPA